MVTLTAYEIQRKLEAWTRAAHRVRDSVPALAQPGESLGKVGGLLLAWF